MSRRERTVANILMLCGAIAWLAGELIGVHRNTDARDTTSEWVWWLQQRPWVGKIARVLVAAFVLSLAGHFWFGWSLLP